MWVNGFAGDTADLTITGGTTDPADATSTSTGAAGAQIDPDSATTPALSGEQINVSEVLGTGNTGTYTATAPVCVTGATPVPVTDGTFTMPNTPVTCTITNTRTENAVLLQKEWVNGFAGDTADLTITGGTTDPAEATSTSTGAAGAQIDPDSATTPALSGEQINVSEVLGTGNTGTYTATAPVCVTGPAPSPGHRWHVHDAEHSGDLHHHQHPHRRTTCCCRRSGSTGSPVTPRT